MVEDKIIGVDIPAILSSIVGKSTHDEAVYAN